MPLYMDVHRNVECLGEQAVKNIPKVVRVYRMAPT
jgi:hypothetical protein